MALANYTDLQSSISSFLNRSDLSGVTPDFVALAEAQIRRDIASHGIEGISQMSVSAEVTNINIAVGGSLNPRVKSIVVKSGSTYRPVEVVSLQRLGELRQLHPASGAFPMFAAFYLSASGGGPGESAGETMMVVLPVPTAAVTCEVVYEPRLVPLATVATNWLLTSHPDVYLYGSLMATAPWLRDDPRLQMWGTLYSSAIASLVSLMDKHKYPNALQSVPRRALGV